jgi:serine/threonine-protein kinase
MKATLGGRYHLVRELGAGSMGRVYHALDAETGRAVAAKVLMSRSDDVDTLLRFQREGMVLSALRHPNIVGVYGTFLDGSTSYIIMEFLRGRSLAKIIREERLSLKRSQQIGGRIVAALDYAHGRGIVHRDVKPDNVMVGDDGRVKVTDFGIARLLESNWTTKSGASMGTPLYMSPEQIKAEPVDGRADVYSTGGVLYHMTTGRPPFQGDNAVNIAYRHLHEAPQPPSEVNPNVNAEWDDVILRSLEKEPAERYQTMLDLGKALAGLPS